MWLKSLFCLSTTSFYTHACTYIFKCCLQFGHTHACISVWMVEKRTIWHQKVSAVYRYSSMLAAIYVHNLVLGQSSHNATRDYSISDATNQTSSMAYQLVMKTLHHWAYNVLLLFLLKSDWSIIVDVPTYITSTGNKVIGIIMWQWYSYSGWHFSSVTTT